MGKEISIKISSALNGHRAEYILEKELKISSSLIKRLKREEGAILLNGTPASVIAKVNEGDILSVKISERKSDKIIPADIPLEILWEDEDIIVLNKPPYMSVHPSKTHKTDTLANAVVYHTGRREVIHIITRLDRETSGVVLMAKNPRAAAILTDDIKCGKIQKEYIAIVNGIPEPSRGNICAPIKKKECRGIARCIAEDGKKAETLYDVIKKAEGFSFVKLYPITGRTHQLRVHMSYIGHPIYGDSMYGAPQIGERVRLHCQRLTFTHPSTQEPVLVEAEIPEDFHEFAEFSC